MSFSFELIIWTKGSMMTFPINHFCHTLSKTKASFTLTIYKIPLNHSRKELQPVITHFSNEKRSTQCYLKFNLWGWLMPYSFVLIIWTKGSNHDDFTHQSFCPLCLSLKLHLHRHHIKSLSTTTARSCSLL